MIDLSKSHEYIRNKMIKLITSYEYIKDPTNLVEHFQSEKEFKDWLSLGTKQDLECTLKEFEQSELYEYCAIIRDEINNYKY